MTEPTSDKRNLLCELIDDRRTAILLDAREYALEKGKQLHDREVLFELPSGTYRQRFITLWEIFDEFEELELCVSELAARIRQVQESKRFSMIVTLSRVAKHLAEHVHEHLGLDGDVELYHFEQYPQYSLGRARRTDFVDRHVIIFTDVIGSGRSVRNLWETLEKLGSRVVAMVCVVLTSEELLASTDQGKVIMRLHGRGLVVHRLCDYPIHDEEIHDPKKSEIIKINYRTLLPQLPAPGDPSLEGPSISAGQMLNDLERCDALDFGFFEVDGKSYSIGVRINRILERNAASIWAAARVLVDDDYVLVTTCKKEDIRFANFVRQHVEEQEILALPVLVAKRDTRDTEEFCFTLFPRTLEWREKKVLLVLATVRTFEEIKNLVSLMASLGVCEVSAVVLLNRMGVYTTGFVERIRNIVGGAREKTDPAADAGTEFNFTAVYSVCDLDGHELSQARRRLDCVMDHFERTTGFPAFRVHVQHLRRKLRPRRFSSSKFLEGHVRKQGGGGNAWLGAGPYEVKTLEGGVYAITEAIARRRDYVPAFECLCAASNPEVMLQITSLLLADVDYLRVTGQMAEARGILVDRVRGLRRRRFGFEREAIVAGAEIRTRFALAESDIGVMVSEEHLFLVCLAMMAHFDEIGEYPEIIEEMVFDQISVQEWIGYPCNLEAHFSSEELFWSIAMLMRSVFMDFYNDPRGKEFRARMEPRIREFMEEVSRRDRGTFMDDEERSVQNARIRNNLDSLLGEFGVHNRQQDHQVIRFLHRRILREKPGHRAIRTVLLSSTQCFESLFSPIPKNRGELKRYEPGNAARLKEGLKTLARLEDICEAIRRFYSFTPIVHENRLRFLNDETRDGLSRDVKRMRVLFEEIGARGSLSYEDYRNLKVLRARILDDIVADGSILRRSLSEYVVDFDALLEESLKRANEGLAKLGFKGVWQDEMERLAEERAARGKNRSVLADKTELREVLFNLLMNVRHSFGEHGRYIPHNHYGEVVSVSVDEQRIFVAEAEKTEQDVVIFTVTSEGKPVRRSDLGVTKSTFRDHQLKVTRLGGRLTAREMEVPSGTITELQLISRSDYA